MPGGYDPSAPNDVQVSPVYPDTSNKTPLAVANAYDIPLYKRGQVLVTWDNSPFQVGPSCWPTFNVDTTERTPYVRFPASTQGVMRAGIPPSKFADGNFNTNGGFTLVASMRYNGFDFYYTEPKIMTIKNVNGPDISIFLRYGMITLSYGTNTVAYPFQIFMPFMFRNFLLIFDNSSRQLKLASQLGEIFNISYSQLAVNIPNIEIASVEFGSTNFSSIDVAYIALYDTVLSLKETQRYLKSIYKLGL